ATITDAVFDGVGGVAGQGALPGGADPFAVLGVDHLQPARGVAPRDGLAGELLPPRRGVGLSGGAGAPDHLRGGLDQSPVAALAAADGLGGLLVLLDVGQRADPPQDEALLVLEGGDA